MDMKRLIMILMAVALVALPTMAQSFGSNRSVENDQQAAQSYTTTQPFRSTSAMQSSGSVYSANPSIGSDGTAYNPVTSNPSGPRKAKKEEGEFDPSKPVIDEKTDSGNTPIGDAVWPLMLMALAYLGMRVFRARKRA